MSSVNDRQVGGSHYQSRYQHWDFVVRVLKNRYLEGAVTKYATRWRKKNGKQDLEKAAHYLQKLIDEHLNQRVQPLGKFSVMLDEAKAFSACNHCGPYETAIISILATWETIQDLRTAEQALHELTDHADIEAQNQQLSVVKSEEMVGRHHPI